LKRYLNAVLLSAVLLGMSAAVYYVHYLIFHDAHHIFIYLLGDVGFVFIEVLLVTLIIHRLLSVREKHAMLKKLNMVIGAFFNEAGTELLRLFAGLDPEAVKVRDRLVLGSGWTAREFSSVGRALAYHGYNVEPRREDIGRLREFLVSRRDFLLRLLENPNLLEHESFTDLLWAVFHLTDELANRTDVAALGDRDVEHLAGDMKRAYGLLVSEWLSYMQHLRDNYPYLFSLAIRTNPFNPRARAEVA
jgi:hypothetical protein